MLSICIPAYTYLDYTYETVQRLLSEDADFELIVVEDFEQLNQSSEVRTKIDETRHMLDQDSRVIWKSNVEKLHIHKNWNNTVSLATRPYVKMMGADDLIVAGGVNKMLKMLSDSPDIVFHAHLAHIINGDGHIIRTQKPYTKSTDFLDIFPKDAPGYKLMQLARFKEPVCNIYLKDNWTLIGGYSNKYRFCSDIDFNIKMMSLGPSRLWNYPLAELRRHAASDGSTLPPDMAYKELRALISETYSKIGHDNLTSNIKAHGEGWMAYRMLELAVARYKTNPKEFIRFIKDNHKYINAEPGYLLVMFKMLLRRVLHNDVQLTVR